MYTVSHTKCYWCLLVGSLEPFCSMWHYTCDISGLLCPQVTSIAPKAQLHGYIVSACVLPPNVLRLHKQHASRNRSRTFMATSWPQKVSPPQNRSSVNPNFSFSSFLSPVQLTGSPQCGFWFGLLLSVSQASQTNCCLLQLHPRGGEVSLFTPSVSVDWGGELCPMRTYCTYSPLVLKLWP